MAALTFLDVTNATNSSSFSRFRRLFKLLACRPDPPHEARRLPGRAGAQATSGSLAAAASTAIETLKLFGCRIIPRKMRTCSRTTVPRCASSTNGALNTNIEETEMCAVPEPRGARRQGRAKIEN